MRVALGLKAHSGWAALVVLGANRGQIEAVERRRIELVEEEWAKQPYHAADGLERNQARDLVQRSIKSAERIATREIKAVAKRMSEAGDQVAGCAVLVGDAMPDWSVEQILAVHFRMHKAEGVLFREALLHAGHACGLRVVAIPEKQLYEHSEKVLKTRMADLWKEVALLGKSFGPPWGKDQKESALAALIVLRSK